MLKAKRKKAPKAVSRGYAVVFTVSPDDGAASIKAALGALKRAKLTAKEWIAVDAGDGSAQALASQASLKRLGFKAVSADPACGDWGRYCAAAQSASAPNLLLLPSLSHAGADLHALGSAAKGAEFALLRDASMPASAARAQKLFWSLPPLDLGAAWMVQRQLFLELSLGENAKSYFLAPRLIRKALLSGRHGVVCDSEAEPAPRGLRSWLGDGGKPLGQGLVRAGMGLGGACVAWMGMDAFASMSATMGVTVAALGLIFVGFALGGD
jgi:hypothetical protein